MDGLELSREEVVEVPIATSPFQGAIVGYQNNIKKMNQSHV